MRCKDNGSTNIMCTFTVKETVQYYLQNGSNVHAALLDATKAFDRINFCIGMYTIYEPEYDRSVEWPLFSFFWYIKME